MSKGKKNKGGRKSPFLINKTEKGYYIDSRSNKRVSEELYKAQWTSKGRASRSAFEKAEQEAYKLNEDGQNISVRYLSESFAELERKSRKYKSQVKNLEKISEFASEVDEQGNFSGFDDENGILYMQTLFYNLGDTIKEYGKKKGITIKILEPESERFKKVTKEEAKEIIIDFIQDLNITNKISKRKGAGSFMPLVGVVENLIKKEVTIDLKNTFGANVQTKNFDLLKSFFK